MTPKAGEAVLYTPCIITSSVLLACYNGPLDGQDGWKIEPGQSDDGHYLLWYFPDEHRNVETCATYRTAWRWTRKNGYEGIVLAHVP